VSHIPSSLTEWLSQMPRVERIKMLGALVDTETIRALARMRRAEIAAELAERGYGGRKSLAAELGITRPETLSETVRRHRLETQQARSGDHDD